LLGWPGERCSGEVAVGVAAEPRRRGLFWGDPKMAITREQVLHVAKLARLALTEDELERLGEQLDAILDAVSKVSELDLSDVPPTSHPLDLVNVLADDVPRPSLPRDLALANAPEAEDGAFRVPPT
jgi:aspartyl-tRNA(Asn)/glutamyl-tRNA(Gln) amidotransferase subunit C